MIFKSILLIAITVCCPRLFDTIGPQRSSCPVISVRCSDEKDCCGSTRSFAVDITGGYIDRTPTFKWTVSKGKIKSGQGTDSIAVDAVCTAEKPLIVTVEVGNVIPEGCPSTASFTTKCQRDQ